MDSILLELFTQEELATLKPIYNTCPHCGIACGTIFTLECGYKMCGQCMDDLYDNNHSNALFQCPDCNIPILDYTNQIFDQTSDQQLKRTSSLELLDYTNQDQ